MYIHFGHSAASCVLYAFTKKNNNLAVDCFRSFHRVSICLEKLPHRRVYTDARSWICDWLTESLACRFTGVQSLWMMLGGLLRGKFFKQEVNAQCHVAPDSCSEYGPAVSLSQSWAVWREESEKEKQNVRWMKLAWRKLQAFMSRVLQAETQWVGEREKSRHPGDRGAKGTHPLL